MIYKKINKKTIEKDYLIKFFLISFFELNIIIKILKNNIKIK